MKFKRIISHFWKNVCSLLSCIKESFETTFLSWVAMIHARVLQTTKLWKRTRMVLALWLHKCWRALALSMVSFMLVTKQQQLLPNNDPSSHLESIFWWWPSKWFMAVEYFKTSFRANKTWQRNIFWKCVARIWFCKPLWSLESARSVEISC